MKSARSWACRRSRGGARVGVGACVVLGAASVLAGCEGAFYGAATGAYVFAEGGGTCCSGGGGSGSADCDLFLLGAVVIGAGIGMIAEIVKWICEGGK